MTLQLPPPVAAYFTADEANGEAVSRCFTEDAVVKDEGHTYNGRAAIQKWKEEVAAKFTPSRQPFHCRCAGQSCPVAQMTGGELSGVALRPRVA